MKIVKVDLNEVKKTSKTEEIHDYIIVVQNSFDKDVMYFFTGSTLSLDIEDAVVFNDIGEAMVLVADFKKRNVNKKFEIYEIL